MCNSYMCNECPLEYCQKFCHNFQKDYPGCVCTSWSEDGGERSSYSDTQGGGSDTSTSQRNTEPEIAATWSRVGDTTRVCDANPSSPLVVGSRGACEQEAISAGTTYYSFNSVSGECITTNQCPDYVEEPNSPWAGSLYRKPSVWPAAPGQTTCRDPTKSVTVADVYECQALAVSNGHVRFLFNDGACLTFNRCHNFQSQQVGWAVHVKPPLWEEAESEGTACEGTNDAFNSERVLVVSAEDCQAEATTADHEYFSVTPAGRCTTMASCSNPSSQSVPWTVHSQGSDWTAIGNKRCELWTGGDQLIFATQNDCQQAGRIAGKKFYSFHRFNGKCVLTDTCNVDRNRNNWRAGEKP